MCTGKPAEKTTFPFMATYARTHPIGIYLLRQWNLFKSMQEEALQENIMEPCDLKVGVDEGDEEIFSNSKNTACTFEEVGDVATSYLEFVRDELVNLNWGGKLHYKISTTGKKGHMHVTAIVEVGECHPTSVMDIKPYFHIM
eukprot:Tbor_TRINITY_DN5619_c0_g1::TRINITY_DN5619_c0_g1_i7::g.8393::m.8393